MTIFIILVIAIIIIRIFLTLNIKIEIKNLKILLPLKSKNIINKESEIWLKIYVLKKIKIAQINLKKIKTDNQKFKERMNKFKKNIKIGFNKNILKYIKNVNYGIEKLNLNILIGNEDAAITAISIGAISSLIGIFLKNKITNIENSKFTVLPIYNTNILKIELDGIFAFNIANIKNIVKFLMKGRVNKNDRTSYRRTYAYSDE